MPDFLKTISHWFIFRNHNRRMNDLAQTGSNISADLQDDTHDVDDPRDANYMEPTVPAGASKITPHQRKGIAEEFSVAARKRVNKVDGKNGRCVTNTLAFDGVQYAHLLARAAKPELLDKLEYHWGMEWGTLHVDSRYNVMRLHIHLHHLFDRNDWILIPEEGIISQLTQATMLFQDRRQRQAAFQTLFDKITTFNYKLISAPSLSTVPFLEYPHDMAKGMMASQDHFKVHCYPFNDLPTITSHARPHFVICNLGIKMQANFVLGDFIDTSDRARIASSFALFKLWTQYIPDNERSAFFNDWLLPRDDEDDTDNNSTVTKWGRLDSAGLRRSSRQHAAVTSPSATSSQKCCCTDIQDSDGLWQDDETLLEGAVSPAKQLKEKMESISAWVLNVCETMLSPDAVV